MAHRLSQLTLNQRLGGAALALGALAVFANVAPGRTLRVNEKQLLTAVERQQDHVTPARARRVDRRGPRGLPARRPARREGLRRVPHPRSGEPAPAPSWPTATSRANEKLVLYGEGAVHASQAWLVLKARGFVAAYTLLGGLDAWKDEVLFPLAPAQADRRRAGALRTAPSSSRGSSAASPAPRSRRAAGRCRWRCPSRRPQTVAAPTLPAGAGGGAEEEEGRLLSARQYRTAASPFSATRFCATRRIWSRRFSSARICGRLTQRPIFSCERRLVEPLHRLEPGAREALEQLLVAQLVVGGERAREVDRVDPERGVEQQVVDVLRVPVERELVQQAHRVDLRVPGVDVRRREVLLLAVGLRHRALDPHLERAGLALDRTLHGRRHEVEARAACRARRRRSRSGTSPGSRRSPRPRRSC